MKIPRSITKLIDHFQRLPGIGPKTAQRLTFQLLHFPQEELERFAESVTSLKKEISLCEECKNISESSKCSVCTDDSRNEKKILVVSNVLDVIALERSGYDGMYHVLHGVIDPLNNIGPEEIFIKEVIGRLKKLKETELNIEEELFIDKDPIEVILGTGSSLEGESTAMYLSKMIRDSGFGPDKVRITRIARGIPVGGDIEYADDVTLSRALEGRMIFEI